MTLNIGLIGATRIAERAVVMPSARYGDATIRAVAASDSGRAATFAARNRIPVVHRDYSALIDDSTINTVYISLHNSAHHTWVARAASAGKHVIVEKPLCLDGDELAAIEEAASATGVRFIEAVPTMGHEWQAAVREMLADSSYGALRSARTRIQFAMPPSEGYRCRPELGGGIFFDASSYWLQAVQAVCGLADATGTGHSDFCGPNGVDSSFSSQLTWPDGREWVAECSFGAKHIAEHEFVFDHAIARLRQFLLPIAGSASLNLVVHSNDAGRVIVKFAPIAYYAIQFARIRDVLTSAASDRVSEDSAAERIRMMAAIFADAHMRRGEATG
ncbi:Gfo/Idh/MocA family protein [Mycolicibacterium sp. P1-5]|uniref:Gfo/Idh/MocA family protein n=1 Tax=Mycolicibacterium sp. P1-5 TaxID=2024617 RepID=UPI0011EF663F|nr:Gfo/Idh/MocA family oxidoreductase [Mycolicibacterium sp. P1-5]